MKPARSREFLIRGLRCHCTCWGDEAAPLLVMLHGWGDAGASFQFVVDALARDWQVVAPDWRGFGDSDRAPGGYWFPDYLADLDALLAQLSPHAPVPLVGHSLGGNVACLYAGIRPARVTSVVAIDAFGLADRPAEEAPGRYEKWLREQSAAPQWRDYDDWDAFARRLQRQNPRLDGAKAAFLARVLGRARDDGRIVLAADPAHQGVNPVLYRRAEAEACWRRVRAPVLWIEPDDIALRRQLGLSEAAIAAGKACFADFRAHLIADAGHNLHHDAPLEVARLIDAFCLAS
ncbi:MAG: alpha/beta hydrolase [Rhodocyclaceae bacterium]|nr:alpha/beta hydrolase [Rhodocyclaceae bacterium]